MPEATRDSVSDGDSGHGVLLMEMTYRSTLRRFELCGPGPTIAQSCHGIAVGPVPFAWLVDR